MELINHPEYYAKNGIEAIDFIEAHGLNFSLGNAMKYIVRSGHKPGEDSITALEKARWYISREIERQKKRRKLMNNKLQLVTSKEFNGVTLDCYIEPEHEKDGEFWATREQIGRLLEYAEPMKSIAKIHERNKERLDKFSTIVKLTTVEGTRTVTREVTVYSFKGLLEICRYSEQPRANAVMDFLWEVADEIRRTGSYGAIRNNPALPSGVIEGARLIFEAAGIKDNQLALAMDKVYLSYTGRSALQAGEIALTAPTKKQILTPTEIGTHF